MQSIIDAIHPALPSTQIPPDEQTVTLEEIKQAIRKFGNNKAPGPDDIGTAFYKENWENVKDHLCDILNQMMLHETTDTTEPGDHRLPTQAKWNTNFSRISAYHTSEQRLQDPEENNSTPYTPGDGKAAREPILRGTREQHL
jgi:hypothetical protein